MDNLVKLDMVDVDVILCMDCFDACNASFACSTQVLKFQFPSEIIIRVENSSSIPKGHFISYHKTRKLVFKG